MTSKPLQYYIDLLISFNNEKLACDSWAQVKQKLNEDKELKEEFSYRVGYVERIEEMIQQDGSESLVDVSLMMRGQ